MATLPAKDQAEVDDETQLQRAVAQLWVAGATIDWRAFHQPAQPHRVALPSYPFQRERFWIDSAPRQTAPAGDSHPAGQIVNASPLHSRPKLQSGYVPPATELEQVIANIWQRSLGIDSIGLEDSFFELGGDSLIAIQVIADLKRELNQEIPVVSLYEGLTIRSLIKLLESSRQQETHAGPQTARAEDREERTTRRKLYQEKQRFKKREAIG